MDRKCRQHMDNTFGASEPSDATKQKPTTRAPILDKFRRVFAELQNPLALATGRNKTHNIRCQTLAANSTYVAIGYPSSPRCRSISAATVAFARIAFFTAALYPDAYKRLVAWWFAAV
mmetsp:Transcript_36119/g.81500  ORF Transcript_36119/g.81500 Transcript_36119/m.81500 type:complete len:118 (-) Transcript_36119:1204-1557(-)